MKKWRVNITIRYCAVLLSMLLPSICLSQTEGRDSLATARPALDSLLIGPAPGPQQPQPPITLSMDYNRLYASAMSPLFAPPIPAPVHLPDLRFTPGQAMPLHWDGGSILVEANAAMFPGMMQMQTGTLGITQSAGPLTVYAGAKANKYGYFRGLHTQYGLAGRLTYRLSRRLSATLFGEYYFGQPPRMANGMPMPPAMIGYYGRSAFGGYLDYQISDRWGVQTGVQTVQQVGTRRHHAEPIVTPYFRFSNKVAIGLPLGQILYHIIQNTTSPRNIPPAPAKIPRNR